MMTAYCLFVWILWSAWGADGCERVGINRYWWQYCYTMRGRSLNL